LLTARRVGYHEGAHLRLPPRQTDPMPTARITILLKPTVLDAQGAVVRDALHSLGFRGVNGVHMGKYIELDLAPGADEAQVREMCQQLLANPIIEQYAVAMSEE
jgi:phosphoribosylformylglycinamidine synthase subunit PurS